MKLLTLWSAYRQAVARRDIAGSGDVLQCGGEPARQRYAKLVRQCDKLERAIDRRIISMEQALQPFATLAYTAAFEFDPDSYEVGYGYLGKQRHKVTAGDFRRAARVLNGGGDRRLQ